MYCKHCGQSVEDDAKFCIHCGQKLETNQLAAPGKAAEPKQQKTKTRGVIIGIIAGLLLTAVCTPLALVARKQVLSSLLNPANRILESSSSVLPDQEQMGENTQAPINTQAPTESPPATAAPALPDLPMVFASDRDDPNFSECSKDHSCWLQVFYTPALLSGQAYNLTGPLGFIGASDPALSTNGKKVAFSGSLPGDQGSQIYVVGIDGTGLTRISQIDYTHYHPSWSPDGSRLVYMSSPLDGTAYNLYVTDIKSGETRAITGGEFMDRFPDWSPDGSLVAFHSNRADPNPADCWPSCKNGLFVINVETVLGNQLFSNGEPLIGAALDWSPDGSQLAYHVSQNGSWEIFIRDDNGSVRQLTDNPGLDTFYPNWSPGGDYLAYTFETSTGLAIAITPVGEYDPVYLDWPGSWTTQPDW